MAEGENLEKNLLARPRSGALGTREELEFATSPGISPPKSYPLTSTALRELAAPGATHPARLRLGGRYQPELAQSPLAPPQGYSAQSKSGLGRSGQTPPQRRGPDWQSLSAAEYGDRRAMSPSPTGPRPDPVSGRLFHLVSWQKRQSAV